LDQYETRTVEMKAGEFLIFTSLVIHGALPNVTTDDTRLAFVGRYTTNDVKVFDGLTHDVSPPIHGRTFDMSLRHIGCTQVHGRDRYGHNRILPPPEGSRTDLAAGVAGATADG
ncbi:MAG: phytanoyl-CoA dioxygenase family protein, partial [Longimicrobiales bacterium]